MHAIAPGKVILSGEHAAVYGAPALAVATDCHIHTRFIPGRSDRLRFSGDLLDYSYALTELAGLAQVLNQRFEAFLAGRLPVDQLLDRPDQLLAYVMSQVSSDTGCLLPGGTLDVRSNLPTGAGMGSSAAAIAATLLLVERLTGAAYGAAERFAIVRYCERLQHGRGSAIDAAAVSFGGLVKVAGESLEHPQLSLGRGWYRVATGMPRVSTGQCVQHVRERFGHSAIWQQFAAVTESFQQALGGQADMHDVIRENHRLLQQIEVVPESVAAFVSAVERLGASAKISGAGAVTGEAGGLLLLYAPDFDPVQLSALCQRVGYTCDSLEEDPYGARYLDN